MVKPVPLPPIRLGRSDTRDAKETEAREKTRRATMHKKEAARRVDELIDGITPEEAGRDTVVEATAEEWLKREVAKRKILREALIDVLAMAFIDVGFDEVDREPLGLNERAIVRKQLHGRMMFLGIEYEAVHASARALADLMAEGTPPRIPDDVVVPDDEDEIEP